MFSYNTHNNLIFQIHEQIRMCSELRVPSWIYITGKNYPQAHDATVLWQEQKGQENK